jgi:hypothetical protein
MTRPSGAEGPPPGVRTGWTYIDVEAGGGQVRLWASWTSTADGLTLQIYGGLAHLGAVAVAYPRPSLRDPAKTSATSSVLTRLGHRDDFLARPASELLAETLNVPVTVVAGVHIGPAGTFQASKDATDELVRSVPRLVQAVVAAIGADRQAF